MNPLIKNNCIICGKEFSVPNNVAKLCKYCGPCKLVARRESWNEYNKRKNNETTRQCAGCGKKITWRTGQGGNSTGYCHPCNIKYRATGENSSQWKGGRRCQKDGYVWIYHPEPHPRRVRSGNSKAGYYVLEHILVWEKYNNKSLPDEYVIHHLNGTRNDNRPENLQAMPKGKHHYALRIQGLQKRIKELENQLSTRKKQLPLFN